MSLVTNLVFSPLLLLITIPLATFAAVTSIFAFSTLFLRALVVYAELAGVLLQNQFMSRTVPTSSRTTQQSPAKHRASSSRPHKVRRSNTASGSSNGGSTTPKATELGGLGAYGSGGPTRDFEGIGGWRMPGSEDEDVLWTHMNSRLELPALTDGRQRNHHRSRTSSSLMAMPMLSPSPTQSRTISGPSSPEEYFANRRPSKSTTSLDTANMGRTLLRHKTGSSSGSSHSSMRLPTVSGSGG